MVVTEVVVLGIIRVQVGMVVVLIGQMRMMIQQITTRCFLHVGTGGTFIGGGYRLTGRRVGQSM